MTNTTTGAAPQAAEPTEPQAVIVRELTEGWKGSACLVRVGEGENVQHFIVSTITAEQNERDGVLDTAVWLADADGEISFPIPLMGLGDEGHNVTREQVIEKLTKAYVAIQQEDEAAARPRSTGSD